MAPASQPESQMSSDHQPTAWVAGNPNDRSVRGFRIRHGGSRGPMSGKLYARLQKEGRGPKESSIDGKTFITPAAEAEWDEQRTNPVGAEAELRERMKAIRHKRALKAGAASAASPRHVSKRGKRRQAK